MGINIHACYIAGSDTTEHGKYLIANEYDAFDSFRHSGDRDFYDEVEFTPHPDGGSDWDERYYRPKDILKAIEWVKHSMKIPESNRPRLIELLQAMLNDSSIYLYFSL